MGMHKWNEIKIMSITISRFTPTLTRPCKYCLVLQNGSVFADFNVDKKGCLYLVRISFDSYGCLELEDTIGKINYDKSQYLIQQIQQDNFCLDAGQILSNYFIKNKKFLWVDALNMYQLIN